MYRIFPRSPLPWWQGLLLAFGASALAWLVRAALDPVLKDQMAYVLFVPGVLVTSVLGGWKSGMAAAGLSGALAAFSFAAPAGRLTLDHSHGWALGLFILVSLMLAALVGALAASLRQEMQLREALVTVSAEYRHRIKNLLTISQSLVDQSARSTGTVSEFKEKIASRLHALARAQDLLHVGKAEAVPLHSLIEAILDPFRAEERLAAPIRGPHALVPADVTVTLALLLNELATNAMKHGALSVPEGRLKLGWTLDGEWTVIEWKELDGPKVAPPEDRGFGSRLFDSALATGSGSSELIFEPDGLRCELRLRTSPCG